MSRAGASSRRRFAILGVALVLRVLALAWADGAELVKDEIAYLDRAEALLDGQGYVGSYQSWVRHDGWKIAELPQYPGAYQPPGYPSFVAALLWIGGGDPIAIRIAQILLGVASTALVMTLGRRWFDERVALAAGALFATYPTLIAFTHYLWTETFFIALLLAAIVLLARPPSEVDRRTAIAGGLVLGVGALTRSAMLPLVAVLAAWPAVEGVARTRARGRWPSREELRPALAIAATVVATTAAVVAPWSVRSSLLHGGFVLIDTNGAYNMWRGNEKHTFIARGDPRIATYSAPFDSLPLHPVANLNAVILIDDLRRERGERFPSDLEVVDYASDVAWRTILGDPAGFVQRGWIKLVDTWNPTSFLLRHFELGAYGEVSPAIRAAITWGHVVAYLAVLVFAAIGLARCWRRPPAWLVLLVIGNVSAAAVLAFGLTRFRMPAMPLLIVMAGVGLAPHLPGKARASDAQVDTAGSIDATEP